MAVISDCHAASGPIVGTSPDTWIVSDRSDPSENPLAGLADFIRGRDLQADALLCAGDLVNRADWSALPYVWTSLEDIADALNTTTIIATAGNHDIDSHELHSGVTVEHGLGQLSPAFPAGNAASAIEFWAARICTVQGDDWQVVSLNSTIMRYLTSGESDRGQIDDETLDRLQACLSDPGCAINVLLCHHHPLPSTHLFPEDRSQMDGGDRLVKLLDSVTDKWFVIHGHKHEPNLDQLGGTGNAPIRLASGSVGANLVPVLAAHVGNQFHLVEFPITALEAANVKLGGHVDSFTWKPRTGWATAAASDGLPARAGFGHWQDGESLARETFAWAKENDLAVLDPDDLLAHKPAFEFMLPSDQRRWATELRRLGCYVDYDLDGHLRQVVMP